MKQMPNKADASETKTAMEKIAMARMGLRNRSPALTKAIYEATFVPTTTVATMAMTERGVLLYNPHFVNSRENKHCQTAIEHELWHWLRDHANRGKTAKRLNTTITDIELNICGDYEINDDLLKSCSFGPDLDDRAMHPKQIEAPEGKTMEEYVVLRRNWLQQQQPPPMPNGKPDAAKKDDESSDDAESDDESSDNDKTDTSDDSDDAGGDSADASQDQSGDDGEDGSAPNDGADDAPSPTSDDSSGGDGAPSDDADAQGAGADSPDEKCSGGVCHGSCGSAAGAPVEAEALLDETAGRDEEAVERMREQVAQQIIEAAAQGRGSYPSDVMRWAESKVQKPKVKWQTLLPKIVRQTLYTKAGSGANSYLHVNRRQAGIGFGNNKPVLAGNRQPVPEVQVWVDTSGSMGTQQLSETLIEVGDLLKNLNGHMAFGVCDAKVHGFKTVKTAEECRKMLKGGGGTDFRPLFRAAMEARTKPDTIIVLTDGMATIPAQPPKGVSVVWVLLGRYRVKTMPWGRCIDTQIGV